LRPKTPTKDLAPAATCLLAGVALSCSAMAVGNKIKRLLPQAKALFAGDEALTNVPMANE
jgi:hypothetical protein